MDYFGTNLNEAGHYFWKLEGEHMRYYGLRFNLYPFNPEGLPKIVENGSINKGSVGYYQIKGWSIIRIEGSCVDTRGGTKSVFFTKEDLTKEQMKERILSIPIAKRMIDKMPFEVKW